MTGKRIANCRPAKVLNIDENISSFDLYERGVGLNFKEIVNMPLFCAEYVLKLCRRVDGQSVGFWAEPISHLQFQVLSFNSILIAIPPEVLGQAEIVYVHTLHENLTYGTEFEIIKAAD